jgi:hypothetical protein
MVPLVASPGMMYDPPSKVFTVVNIWMPLLSIMQVVLPFGTPTLTETMVVLPHSWEVSNKWYLV